MRKRLVMLALLLGLFALPLATSGGTVSAEPGGASDTVAACRTFDNDATGFTFGECVAFYNIETSENANNTYAGLCGAEFIQAVTRTTNKGDCIKYYRPSR